MKFLFNYMNYFFFLLVYIITIENQIWMPFRFTKSIKRKYLTKIYILYKYKKTKHKISLIL